MLLNPFLAKTTCRIVAVTAQAQTLLSRLRRKALDRLRVLLNIILCYNKAVIHALKVITYICRERSEKSLLTWEKVEECAVETGIVDKLEVIIFFILEEQYDNFYRI